MRKISLIVSCIVLVSFYSCSSDEQVQTLTQFGSGIFIVNEGGFGNANASVDFYNTLSNVLSSNLFLAQNNIPLGDIASSMQYLNERYVVVVNNSNKVYALNGNSFKTEWISNINSPRNIFSLGIDRALVTSMDGKIYLINPTNGSVVKTVNTGYYTERIMMANGTIYIEYRSMLSASNHTQGFLILDSDLNIVKNIATDYYPDGSLMLGNDIYSVFMDPNYTGTSILKKMNISTQTFQTIDSIRNVYKGMIDAYQNQVFYVSNDTIKKVEMSIGKGLGYSGKLNFTSPYAFYIHQKNGDFYVADAKDFASRSSVSIYNSSGIYQKNFSTGIATTSFFAGK